MKHLHRNFHKPASTPMKRRTFMSSTAAALALSLFDTKPSLAKPSAEVSTRKPILKDARMGIVVHSYASRWNAKVSSQKYPGFTNALDLLIHTHSIGGSGIQVGVKDWTKDFAGKIRDKREKLGLYIEGSIGMPYKSEDVPAFEKDIIAAKEAGVQVVRTVCTSGRRYEVYHSPEDFNAAYKNATTSLQLAEPILGKHKVKLGVENHKDWRAKELAAMVKQMNSEWIGVTLDFGNSIALMEDPLEVVKTLAPYLFTTHVKDMGVDEYANGLLLSEVPLGTGILDLSKIISICREHNPNTTYNLEMITRDPLEIPCLTDDYWQTFDGVPPTELVRTLRMVKTNRSKTGLPRVSQLTNEERLAVEEKNILDSLSYSSYTLGLK